MCFQTFQRVIEQNLISYDAHVFDSIKKYQKQKSGSSSIQDQHLKVPENLALFVYLTNKNRSFPVTPNNPFFRFAVRYQT